MRLTERSRIESNTKQKLHTNGTVSFTLSIEFNRDNFVYDAGGKQKKKIIWKRRRRRKKHLIHMHYTHVCVYTVNGELWISKGATRWNVWASHNFNQTPHRIPCKYTSIRQRRRLLLLLLCYRGCRRCRKKHLQKVFEFIIVNMRNYEVRINEWVERREYVHSGVVWMRTLNITMKNKMKLNERMSESEKPNHKHICMQIFFE